MKKIRFSRTISNKYLKDAFGDKKLFCEEGYRLIQIVAKNVEDVEICSKFIDGLVETLKDNKIDCNIYPGSEVYVKRFGHYEADIIIDEDMIKEFKKLWLKFKKNFNSSQNNISENEAAEIEYPEMVISQEEKQDIADIENDLMMYGY